MTIMDDACGTTHQDATGHFLRPQTPISAEFKRKGELAPKLTFDCGYKTESSAGRLLVLFGFRATV
jgi:hypothetical protein